MRAVSYLAPQMFGIYRAICAALEKAFGERVHLTQAEFDPLDDPALFNGEVDIAFICGLPLARLVRQGAPLDVLAAPVMSAPRYGNAPAYFADFIVRANSYAQTLSDLAGTVFAINDLGSNSGLHMPRHHLMRQGFAPEFFGSAVISGAHQTSVRWVSEGRVDCAAIDSTVLDHTLLHIPSLRNHIRVIDSTASCPVPPIVLHSRHAGQRKLAQVALASPDESLHRVLMESGIRRLAPVETVSYHPIGGMFDAVNRAGYSITGQISVNR